MINPVSYLTYGLQGQTTTLGTPSPTLFEKRMGSFYVPQNCEQGRVARQGLQFIVLIQED